MTQIALKAAIGLDNKIDEQDEEKRTEEKFQYLVRIKRPSGNGPWYAGGKLGGMEAEDDLTGHTFCAHVHTSGSKKWYGFYPKGAISGWDSLPEEDQIAGVKDFFKYVAGYLYNGDADHAYDDEKLYEIKEDKYQACEKFSAKWKQDKKKYSLALQNCTSFVRKDAKSAGCPVPSGGWPFDNPQSFGKNVSQT